MKVTELKELLKKSRPKLKLVEYKVNDTAAGHRYLGVERQATHINSVGFGLLGGTDAISYCDWPKASELSGNSTRFTIKSEIFTLTYEVIPCK